MGLIYHTSATDERWLGRDTVSRPFSDDLQVGVITRRGNQIPMMNIPRTVEEIALQPLRLVALHYAYLASITKHMYSIFYIKLYR